MRILENRIAQLQLWFISLYLLSFTTTVFSQRTTITVSGIVTEEVSGKAVIGANVILYEDTASTKPLFGASTNRYGFYSIANVPRGIYLVVVRAIGYETFKRTYSLRDTSKSFRLNIKIKEESVLLKEVEVKGLRETESQAQVSAISIKPEILHQLPSMTGEVDLFRTLQLLPGVKTATEMSTGLYVRGGSPDQTLTLLDGVIVYNPSHLGNFASTFNTDAIQDIRLIKGAFPAEYGGRLSSVLDIKLREGTKENVGGKVGLSMVSSNLMVEGPLSSKSTFMFSGRRMYYDFLQDRFYSTSTLPRYNFYDLNGKIHFSVSESDWLSFSGLLGLDKIYSSKNSKDIEYNIEWSNQTFNFNWTHINSESMFSNTSLSYTNYFFDVLLSDKTKITSSKDYYSSSDLKDFSFRRETEYFPNEDHSIKFGTDVALHLYNLVSSDVVLTEEEKDQGVGSEYLSLEAVLYAQDEWSILPYLTTNIGGRIYYFKDRKYLRFEPRISLSYAFTDKIFLKAAYAVAHQYLHLILRNDISLPTDLWFPSTSKIQPSRSDQYIVGIESNFFDDEYFISLEGYYKDMKNLYEYGNKANFSLDTKIEDQLVNGKGEAYGIEFFLNKRFGNLTGWIGYTLSWTRRLFDELNVSKIFYPRYDRRHDISVVATYKFSDNLTFSATWTYGTGQAYTLPTGQYSFVDIGGVNPNKLHFNYTERNTYRLPDYHKLDISANYTFDFMSKPLILSLGVYNVYNRLNPFAQYITYEKDEASEGRSIPKLKQLTLFPIIPTLGIIYKF